MLTTVIDTIPCIILLPTSCYLKYMMSILLYQYIDSPLRYYVSNLIHHTSVNIFNQSHGTHLELFTQSFLFPWLLWSSLLLLLSLIIDFPSCHPCLLLQTHTSTHTRIYTHTYGDTHPHPQHTQTCTNILPSTQLPTWSIPLLWKYPQYSQLHTTSDGSIRGEW